MSIIKKGPKGKKFGYVGSSNDLDVILYLNTEKHHKGERVKIPVARFQTCKEENEQMERFKSWCYDKLRAHTPTMRVYSIPSHRVVKKLSALKEGGKYLVVGKEYTLGTPKHTNRDYPQVLVPLRKKYLKELKEKKAMK